MKKIQTLGRKPKKRGPKTPPCGRVRVTVNLPRDLIHFVDIIDGRSRSDRIVQAITALRDQWEHGSSLPTLTLSE